MSRLDDLARHVAQAAGWAAPQPGGDGAYAFRLEGDLDVTLFSPDGRTGIMRADLVPLPDDSRAADTLLADSARHALARGRTRKSVVALDGTMLVLHRQLNVDTASPDEAAAAMRDFLNDLAWWKRTLVPSAQGSAPAGGAMPAGVPWIPIR